MKEGARQLLAQAVEAELAEFAGQAVEGKQAVVRNGDLPERTIQTGLGEVRDRSGQGIKFNSTLVPPYLKRTKRVEEFIPWLYLKGVSTGDMQSTLETLLGEGAGVYQPELSAASKVSGRPTMTSGANVI